MLGLIGPARIKLLESYLLASVVDSNALKYSQEH